MNDRFKFRIWYEPEKKMMLFNNPTLLDGKVCSNDNGGLLFRNYDHNIKNVGECKPEDFTLMQCTGLKDKNGELIFEGDILRQPDGVVDYVQCGKGCFIHNGVAITNYDRLYQGEKWAKEVNTHEILGNVFQEEAQA